MFCAQSLYEANSEAVKTGTTSISDQALGLHQTWLASVKMKRENK